MSSGAHLAIRPELCDRCGHCVRACPQGKLRVGAGYIYVDVSACTGCFSCVEVCERKAITRRVAPSRPVANAAAISSADVGKVVVGSRAEAKALRKAAEAAERQRAKDAASANTTRTEKATTGGETGVRWTLVDAAAVAAVLLVTIVAKSAVLGSQAVAVMPPSGQVAARALSLGVFYAVQLGVLAFLAHRHGASLPDAFDLRPSRVSAGDVAGAAGLVAVLLLATRVASTTWGAVSQAAGWMPPATEALTAVFGSGGIGLGLSVVMVVVVGPFAEELAFRGVMTRSLSQRFDARVAIAGSAAVFSAYHATLWVLVPTFVLGCALGWLALTRRSLWPAIALHALYNALVVGVAFWLPLSG